MTDQWQKLRKSHVSDHEKKSSLNWNSILSNILLFICVRQDFFCDSTLVNEPANRRELFRQVWSCFVKVTNALTPKQSCFFLKIPFSDNLITILIGYTCKRCNGTWDHISWFPRYLCLPGCGYISMQHEGNATFWLSVRVQAALLLQQSSRGMLL